MNNTIPFHSAPHAPQITVDVNILSMLKQAASCLTEMASENVYLAAIGPDMELTIIMEEDIEQLQYEKVSLYGGIVLPSSAKNHKTLKQQYLKWRGKNRWAIF